jgi:hypothetical protein
MLQLQPSVLSLVCASDSGLNVSDREDSVLSAQQAVVPGRLPLPGAGVQRPAYPVLRVRPHPAQHGVPRGLISHATWYTTRCTMTIVPDTRDEDKATDMATYASLRLDLWVGQMPRDHISLHGMLPARCMSQQIRRIQTDTLRGAISRAPCRMLLAVVWPELQDVGRGMCALLVVCCCPLSYLGTCYSWVRRCALLEVSYHMPVLFQFSIHTLLIMFFGHLCHRSRWTEVPLQRGAGRCNQCDASQHTRGPSQLQPCTVRRNTARHALSSCPGPPPSD